MLIAEIGNNHFGDRNLFLELCKAAKDSGADIVKSQAGVKAGSMDQGFYLACDLGLENYIELIYECRDKVGIDLFYSIFHQDYNDLIHHTNYFKLAASQSTRLTKSLDTSKMITSVKSVMSIDPSFKRVKYLYASDYLADELDLKILSEMTEKLGRPVGYSDHTVGPSVCIRAIKEYGAPLIEKHFTIEKHMKFNDKIFRDTIFAATPNEMEEIAKCFIERGMAL